MRVPFEIRVCGWFPGVCFPLNTRVFIRIKSFQDLPGGPFSLFVRLLHSTLRAVEFDVGCKVLDNDLTTKVEEGKCLLEDLESFRFIRFLNYLVCNCLCTKNKPEWRECNLRSEV